MTLQFSKENPSIMTLQQNMTYPISPRDHKLQENTKGCISKAHQVKPQVIKKYQKTKHPKEVLET
eukprot:12044126-Ditylum_brightwellii.AAC.1